MTYDQLLQEEEKRAKQNIEAYAAERQQHAAEEAARVAAVYERQQLDNRERALQTVEQTKRDYRDAYDANAVEELVARRNTVEEIANGNLMNSGLNNTQHTTISLMRGSADAAVTQQRQTAIDKVMQSLDELNAEADAASAEKQAKVYEEAYDDVDSYRAQAMKQAATAATKRYAADPEGEEEKRESVYIPSYHTIRAGAVAQRYHNGDENAAIYLEDAIMEGHLTADQWKEIVDWMGLSPVPETKRSYEHRIDKILSTGGEAEARSFIQYLLELRAIDYERAEELRAYLVQ